MATPPELSRKCLFCLEESVWSHHLGMADETSVLPTLESLKRMGELDQFVHRHSFGLEEFERYLSLRQQPEIQTFGTVYFAFHGSSNGLQVGRDDLNLNQLATMLGDFRGGVVHLSSCAVLKDREEAREFLKQTRARLISGYDRNVTWLDSIALDTAWLGYLAHYKDVGYAVRLFKDRYRSLIDHLRWVAYAKSRPRGGQ